MKNIHLLPTEKPSRLFDCFGKLSIGDFNATRESLQVTNQHIYITSDEEIKEGDYAVQFHYGKISIVNCDSQNKSVINNKSLDLYATKIILTTDQDLIAEGVQSIDNEFLEWFVENLSCEFVKVDKPISRGVPLLGYKIMIPQEEPKQETLEEAAERNCESITHPYCDREKSMFFKGAEWQAERMYSEEEVIDILYSFHKEENSRVVFSLSGITKWFEQFKKK
jgi:hypothetical protein